jgi:undecaprenyl-diphosphatase
MHLLSGIDTRIFQFINKVWANPAFNVIMPFISELGTGEAIFLVSVLCYILRRKKDKGALAILLFVGLTVTYYIVSSVKGIVERPRPFTLIPDANLFAIEKSFSFPSNHAASAFMAATILSEFFGSWRAGLFFVAGLIGYSRVYLGVHFLSDVVAGAVIGILIGRAVLHVGKAAGLMAADGC